MELAQQKLEKIGEIRFYLMVELEKAEILLKICQDETITDEMERTDLVILSRIAYNTVLSGAKLTENIGLVLMENNIDKTPATTGASP